MRGETRFKWCFLLFCFKGLAQIIKIGLFVKTTKLILKELNLDSGSVTMLLIFLFEELSLIFFCLDEVIISLIT